MDLISPKILSESEALGADEVLRRLKYIATKMKENEAYDYWVTKEGQEELRKMSEKQEESTTT